MFLKTFPRNYEIFESSRTGGEGKVFCHKFDLYFTNLTCYEKITPCLFYKNPFYKNYEAQNRQKIKNILRIFLRLKASNLIRI